MVGKYCLIRESKPFTRQNQLEKGTLKPLKTHKPPNVPVKVFPAVDLALSEETLFVQQFPAHLTLDAARMPGFVQEMQEEPVQDGAGAPRALHGHHVRRVGGLGRRALRQHARGRGFTHIGGS